MSTRTDADPGIVSLTRVEVFARVRRFGALRAAQRALVPSMRDPSELPGNEGVRDLRDDLQKLVDAIKQRGAPVSVEATQVAAIDESLDGYAERLRHIADAIAIAQFRASLSEAIAEQREEAAALLDLVLEDENAIPERFCLIDYLVTLLSISKTEEGWSVVVDPANVSELIRAMVVEAPEIAPEVLARITNRFQAACRHVKSGGDFNTVVREMGAFKTEIVPQLFHPEVLRCLVSYNLAVRVLREEQLLRARAQDREVRIPETRQRVRPSESGTPASRESAPPATAAESVVQDASPESVLGSPGLAALESALDSRLVNAACPPGPMASLAGLLDLSIVDDRDLSHLRGVGSSEQARLAKRIIVLGLIAQRVDELQKSLSAAGIDPVVLVREWMDEMADFVRVRSNQMVTTGRYLEAKEISYLHARLLFLPFAKQSRVAEAETVVAQRAEEAAATAERAEAIRRARRGAVGPRGDAKKPPAALASRKPVVAKPPMRFAAVARHLLLGAMCIAMGLVWYDANRVRPDRNTVENLSSQELEALSPYLIHATKDVTSNRALFMGILDDRWFQMGELDQRAAAEILRRRLAAMRLHNVMLFNRNKALKIHYEGSLNRMPGWPPIPDE